MMKGFVLFTLLLIILAFGFSQNQPMSWSDLLKAYNLTTIDLKKAEAIEINAGDDDAQLEKADDLYTKALNSFQQVLPKSEEANYDSLSLFLKLNIAYTSFILGKNEQAKSNYLAAINLKQHLQGLSDTILFLPYIYTGAIYYSLNQFDSAMHFYKQAEKINQESQQLLDGTERLYNRLGAMYYETGNYRQARNYFEKAIITLQSSKKKDNGLLANYAINIAAVDVKLEDYEKAKSGYKKILETGIFSDEIYHNLSIIFLKEENFKEALQYLKKIRYENSKKRIELFYNFAVAWKGLRNKDSVNFYFEKAVTENGKWYGTGKSIPLGLIARSKGDLATEEKFYRIALANYQQAIINFDNNFSDKDSTKNPVTYSGIFSYINLFNTLIAKADVFEKIYGQEKRIENLDHALSAYQSAFSLATYVEKTYETDEARLFLGKIKYLVHSRPIDVSLLLYDLTKDNKYLEAAWNFDQRNKASVLALNLQVNEWKDKLTNSNELLQKEASLKQQINRLLIKAQQSTDSVVLMNLNSNIRDQEIELSKVQQEINELPEWKMLQTRTEIPDLKELQKELDNSTAIISYHFSDTRLLIFCVTAGNVFFRHPVIDKQLFNTISSFRQALQNSKPGESYSGNKPAKELFNQLVAPVISQFTNIQSLVIIPDDELHYLPFEALQDEENKYMLQHFSIQYLYSASLFRKDESHSSYNSLLGFAPFVSSGYKDSNIVLNRLPYSGGEIKQEKGKAFTDLSATKQNFLINSNQYPVLHLATHASVDNANPDRSYIAFYPSANDYLLYAPEIYNLDLDSTQLVILSACETGTGQLVRGEGLMSLSRAFAYAGCPNIITSLWKAEDRTTSFITKKLYDYLKEGYSKSIALQKAKVDLLISPEISPALKTPNYWAHLIFIGDYEPGRRSFYPTWFIMTVCLVIAGIILWVQQRNKRTVTGNVA